MKYSFVYYVQQTALTKLDMQVGNNTRICLRPHDAAYYLYSISSVFKIINVQSEQKQIDYKYIVDLPSLQSMLVSFVENTRNVNI